MSVVPSRFNPLEYVSASRQRAIGKKLAQNQLTVRLTVVDIDTLPVAPSMNSSKLGPIEPKNPVFTMGELKPNDRTKFTVVAF